MVCMYIKEQAKYWEEEMQINLQCDLLHLKLWLVFLCQYSARLKGRMLRPFW